MAEDMMEVEVRNLAEVTNYLEVLPEESFDDAKKIFQKAVIDADKTIKLRFSSGIIKSRTGTLRRSLQTNVSGTSLASLKASVYSAANVDGQPVRYARIQEFGGTVTAKNAFKRLPGGPYLTIPTDSNKTPAGVMRKDARMLFNAGAHVHKSKAGNWGIFMGSKMMMVLKHQVKIPARFGMIESAEKEIPTVLSSLANIIGEY